MTTVQTKDLTGRALDYAVALAEGGSDPEFDGVTWSFNLAGAIKVLAKGWAPSMSYCPSADWAHGGPIIEREVITLTHPKYDCWTAHKYDDRDAYESHVLDGPTPLIAAMRCFVASKLGETIDIPQELLP